MKSSLLGLFLLLLLSSSTVCGLGSVVSKYYRLNTTHVTWKEAQNSCRSSIDYTDLAIIHTQSDTDQIYMEKYKAWFGLHRVTESHQWEWIRNWNWADGTINDLWLWDNRPEFGDDCAYADYDENNRVSASSCEFIYFFYCSENQYAIDKFIPQSKTWSEAQQYCKDKHHDLAIFKSYFEYYSAIKKQDFPVWTGLHRDGETWKWSTGLSEYRNWALNEPGTNGDCVSLSSVRKDMATQDCSARFPFVCFKDNLVLVKENKTWEEALEHCHTLNYKLVSTQPGEDHSYLINRVKEADTEEVWAGLRFLAGNWLWVNGADVLYSDLPVCPKEGQHCGAFSKNDKGRVEVRDCSEKRNFMCYS